MSSFVTWIRALALALGAPGLFIIAGLDSSLLSLPEIADLLVVYMVTRHKSRFLLYAASATLGSLSGCLILYYLGRKGGEPLVRRRFGAASMDRATAAFQRHGVMAVLIPAILPPPMPFKIFVLLAGVTGIGPGKFIAAVIVGRGFRYLTLALLAVEYGDFALTFMHEHAVAVSLGAVGVLAAGFFIYLLWSKVQRREGR